MTLPCYRSVDSCPFSNGNGLNCINVKRYRPDSGKTICLGNGHFGPFWWLGNTEDYGKITSYDFLFTFSSRPNHGCILLGFQDIDDVSFSAPVTFQPPSVGAFDFQHGVTYWCSTVTIALKRTILTFELGAWDRQTDRQTDGYELRLMPHFVRPTRVALWCDRWMLQFCRRTHAPATLSYSVLTFICWMITTLVSPSSDSLSTSTGAWRPLPYMLNTPSVAWGRSGGCSIYWQGAAAKISLYILK